MLNYDGVNFKDSNYSICCYSNIFDVNPESSFVTLLPSRTTFLATFLYSGNLKKDYLFMYNRDKSILYFYAKKKYFSYAFKIHRATLEKHISKKTYYLGKYSLISEYNPRARDKEMSVDEVSKMFEKDRLKFRRKLK